MRPQRNAVTARWRSSRSTMTAASSVGATLKRWPGRSTRSSAPKISASSEVDRSWLKRPHMQLPVSSGAMDQPRSDASATDAGLDAARATQGPLSAAIAVQLVRRGRERLDAGEAQDALADFQRVVGHSEANVTAAAWLGVGDSLYR